jgi:PQQ-dependent dehydrogenase (methanol/ethanol family)
MRFARLHLLAVVVGAVALLCTASAMAAPGGAVKRAADIPLAATNLTGPGWDQFAAADWATVGGDYKNDRYSTLDQINTSNVASLKQAWKISLPSANAHCGNANTTTCYRGEASPIVYQGVMYMANGNDDVWALDATTGAILWEHLSSMAPSLTNICCGWDNRGVAIGDGRVYVAQLDGKLIALDQKTGGVLWAATNGRFQDGYTMTMAPVYYNGLVIVGVSGSEQGARGSVTAYNSDTGRRVWRFYNVPTPGDIGAGTWANNNEWQTGGATVWNNPALDTATGTITYSTANPDPWAGRGPGDNLFAVSYVALDAVSGDYRWHFQVVHHEIWDYDCPSPTMMYDTVIGGKMTQVMGEFCKTGWLYQVDRTTGNPVTQIDEKAVPQNAYNNTSPTQPIPAGDPLMDQCAHASDYPATAPDGKPFIIACIWTPYDDQQFVAVQPGAGGGTVVATGSFNPNTGMAYNFVANGRSAFKSIPNASSLYRNGRSFTGIQSAGAAPTAITTGQLVAVNTATNKIAWKQNFTPTGTFNTWIWSSQPGTITTAGNLLFTGAPGGIYWGLQAYNATTGQLIAQFPTSSAIEAPPMTYSVNGKQYVALFSGGRNVQAPMFGATPTGGFTHNFDLYVWTL